MYKLPTCSESLRLLKKRAEEVLEEIKDLKEDQILKEQRDFFNYILKKFNSIDELILESDQNITVYKSSFLIDKLRPRDIFLKPLDIIDYKEYDCQEERSDGLADSIPQILNFIKKENKHSGKDIVVLVNTISKDDQPKRDGMRWCKFPPYVGELESTSDYLYDEKYIKEIVHFNIYEVVKLEREQV